MEKYITNNLLDGEDILWIGRPKNTSLMDKPYGLFVIIRWILAVLLIALCAYYPGYASGKAIAPDRAILIVAVCAIVALLLIVMPFFTMWKLKNKCLYCVTNKRAIICRSAGVMSLTFRMLDDINEVSFDSLPNGCGIVYVGPKTEESRKKARDQSVARESSAEQLPLMFYSISETDVVCSLIEKCCSIKATAADEAADKDYSI